MKKILLTLTAVIIFLVGIYFFWLAPKYTVPILTYHSINYGEGSHFVTPENFAKQMEYIKQKGYEVMSLDELVEGLQKRESFKRNKVVITFDDGYYDNFKYAYPVLKKFGFTAIIFLITNNIAVDDRDVERFLNWDEIRLMFENNISFGSHTKTHFYLGTADNEKVIRDEVQSSKKAIEQEIGMPVKYLCYPTGGFNERVKEIVRDAGYKGACTTNRGIARFNSDVYELKRVKVTNSDMVKPFSFWSKLSGHYNLFRNSKNSH